MLSLAINPVQSYLIHSKINCNLILSHDDRRNWRHFLRAESMPQTADSFKDTGLQDKYLCFVPGKSEMIHMKYMHSSLQN